MSDESQQREAYALADSEVRHEPAAARARLRMYVAALTLFPFLLVFGTLFWMSTGFYTHHSQYAYLAGLGYGAKLHGADCDVVVSGDSTALVGIIPLVVEHRTGLKTCNIAEFSGVQALNGLAVPDAYRTNNRARRFMVFQYAPEHMNSASTWSGVATYEGVYFRLHFAGWRGFLRLLRDFPGETMTGAEFGFRNGLQWMLSRPLSDAKLHVRDANGGQLPLPAKSLAHCLKNAEKRLPDPAWLANLRQRYGVDGTQVLINPMPEPPCDETRGYYDEHFTPGLLDSQVGTLPIEVYNDSGRLHVNDDGAQMLSNMLADQILAHERTTVPAKEPH